MKAVGETFEIALRIRRDQPEFIAGDGFERSMRAFCLADQQTGQLVGLVQERLRISDIDHQHVGHELALHMQRRQHSAAARLRCCALGEVQIGERLRRHQGLAGRPDKGGEIGPPDGWRIADISQYYRSTGGLERILDFIFLGASTANGYDALGHFLRAEGVATICVSYSITPAAQCAHKLLNTATPAKTASVNDPATTGVVMARTLAVLKGATPAQALARYPGATSSTGSLSNAELTGIGAAGTSAQPVGGASAGTTYYTPSVEGAEAGGMLLNYLLGN